MRSVAVLAYEGVSMFGLGVAAELFGCDRSGEGLPRYDYAVTAAKPGLIRTDVGIPILVEAGLDRLSSADLAIVVCWDDPDSRPPEPVLDALRTVAARGGRLVSQCTGAFVLAAAGLLDGRRATTHWKYASQLASRYPQIHVDPQVLYVEDGNVITSAGTAAGIDACLHVVRLEHGAATANEIARGMVVAPHREGGQAQFVPAAVVPAAKSNGANDAGPSSAGAGGSELAALHDWVRGHLHEPVTVAQLAGRLHMAPRTFARWFSARTGTTPHQWLTSQRLNLAQELLEGTDRGVEQIAAECGLTPLMLRRHFGQRLGITPQAYRRRFTRLARAG